MLNKFKTTIGRNIINIPGWRGNRKIVVIESDDWGTIRMPNSDVRSKIVKKYPTLFCSETYDRVDNIANSDDFSALFEVLGKHKDHMGHSAVMTANTVVANPDFKKIKESGYNEYYYEPFTTTLERYSRHSGTFSLWQEGVSKRLFVPQYHTREHLNIGLWMAALKADIKGVREIFEYETWPMKLADGQRLDMAYNYKDSCELQFVLRSLEEGFKLFEQIFGYKSKSFIAPSYVWDDIIEKKMAELGALYIQGTLSQTLPNGSTQNKKARLNYTGKNNDFGQTYLMRNVHFEPALESEVGLVDKILNKIDVAFRWKKPAIISSHRLNYIGTLNIHNRDRTLFLLDEILTRILLKYPDVEFMTSDELGDVITNVKL